MSTSTGTAKSYAFDVGSKVRCQIISVETVLAGDSKFFPDALYSSGSFAWVRVKTMHEEFGMLVKLPKVMPIYLDRDSYSVRELPTLQRRIRAQIEGWYPPHQRTKQSPWYVGCEEIRPARSSFPFLDSFFGNRSKEEREKAEKANEDARLLDEAKLNASVLIYSILREAIGETLEFTVLQSGEVKLPLSNDGKVKLLLFGQSVLSSYSRADSQLDYAEAFLTRAEEYFLRICSNKPLIFAQCDTLSERVKERENSLLGCVNGFYSGLAEGKRQETEKLILGRAYKGRVTGARFEDAYVVELDGFTAFTGLLQGVRFYGAVAAGVAGEYLFVAKSVDEKNLTIGVTSEEAENKIVEEENAVREKEMKREAEREKAFSNMAIYGVKGVLIDGNNVCRYGTEWDSSPFEKNAFRVRVLETLIEALNEKGLNWFCFTDANFRYLVDECDSVADKESYKRLMEKYGDKIQGVPSRTPADNWILGEAKSRGWHIISNDNFEKGREVEYQDYLNVKNEYGRRLHHFMVLRDVGVLSVDDFKIRKKIIGN